MDQARMEGDQHFFPRLISLLGLVMLCSENHGHSSMDLGDKLVGLTGYQSRERFERNPRQECCMLSCSYRAAAFARKRLL
jgi:hypothetical protein